MHVREHELQRHHQDTSCTCVQLLGDTKPVCNRQGTSFGTPHGAVCAFIGQLLQSDMAGGTDLAKGARLVYSQVYSQLQPEQSQVVHTAWAILALVAAGYHHRATRQMAAAVRYLLARQLPSGDWPQEHITGVFNRNCMITYANYRCESACSACCMLQANSACDGDAKAHTQMRSVMAALHVT